MLPSRAAKINYALASVLIGQGQTLAEVAPKVGAKNATVLRVGLAKRGVTQTALRRIPKTEVERDAVATVRIVKAARELLKETSESTRMRLANVTEKLGVALEEKPIPRSLDGQNLFADTLGKTVKAAAGIHGWDDQKPTTLVFTGQIDSLDPSAPAIDVPTCAPLASDPVPEISSKSDCAKEG